ncbi:MAG: hypothetical protein KatS3mg057_3125 [Herpetosiphonaceae bacterium]|nr:MAG: hypothetical protein KatS3mg057_3125 [Herpetosiphonaceae bacterium]
MDTLSHALWGYAVTRWRGPRTARWGAVMGAAPDLLYSSAALIDRISRKGLSALNERGGADPSIWRRDGPPLPEELVYAYNTYYVWTHSLIILAAVALIWYLLRRRPPWLLLPWLVHILMDIPTHERYETPFLFPLSDFKIIGYSWGRPAILIANLTALALVYFLLYRRYWSKHRAAREQPWPEEAGGIV